jgi:hypothetical protein
MTGAFFRRRAATSPPTFGFTPLTRSTSPASSSAAMRTTSASALSTRISAARPLTTTGKSEGPPTASFSDSSPAKAAAEDASRRSRLQNVEGMVFIRRRGNDRTHHCFALCHKS